MSPSTQDEKVIDGSISEKNDQAGVVEDIFVDPVAEKKVEPTCNLINRHLLI